MSLTSLVPNCKLNPADHNPERSVFSPPISINHAQAEAIMDAGEDPIDDFLGVDTWLDTTCDLMSARKSQEEAFNVHKESMDDIFHDALKEDRG